MKTKKTNWESLEFGTFVVDNNTGREYEVTYLGKSWVNLMDVCSLKFKDVTRSDLENEFDWFNK